MAERPPQTIELRLARAEEMFVLDQTDLFSEFRNFLTGVEYAISVLRGHRSRRPLRLDVALPAAEADDGTARRITRTLRRYCDDRIAYNQRERRATRFDGLSALVVGMPIVIAGFLVVVFGAHVAGRHQNANLVIDSGGWVLVWVGMWFPLDTLVFSPLAYGREIRALRRLRTADIVVRPSSPVAPVSPGSSPAATPSSASSPATPSGA
jgi:hypothetical protein